MPKRSSKRQSQDVPATGGEKSPAAGPLGRLGGIKGGPARKRKLSGKRRSETAKKAADARWGKRG